ncbi:MAG: helix-turn-helix domain-containing protein, partial [Methylotenera sp.]|nr:helix-turn-helix domain-containing protein [Methylotenera sp.]
MERTGKQYKHLSAEERATIMLMQREGNNMREVGRYLNRSASTISRELARDLATESGYGHTSRRTSQSLAVPQGLQACGGRCPVWHCRW